MTILKYIYLLVPFNFHELYRIFVFQVESENSGLTWWGALLLLGLIILVVVLALAWNASKTKAPASEHASVEAHEAALLPSVPATADDLAVIEGIDPKIASLLRENGITTFEQLKNADLAELRSILEKAGLRATNPSSWPGQATLAARADWSGLQALKERLKGGRE